MNEYLLTFSTAGVFVLIVGFAWMAAMLIRIRLHQEQLERHEYTVWEKLSVMSENKPSLVREAALAWEREVGGIG